MSNGSGKHGNYGNVLEFCWFLYCSGKYYVFYVVLKLVLNLFLIFIFLYFHNLMFLGYIGIASRKFDQNCDKSMELGNREDFMISFKNAFVIFVNNRLLMS